MSLSANDQAPYAKTSSGKTPPPAPSAAYAKRAREIQAEEGLAAGTGHYRPPALRVLAQGGSPSGETPPNTSVAGPRENDHVLPPTNYPQNFRRARAGTLPSNVSLAAQHFASTLESTPDSPSYDAESFSQTSSPAATSPTTRPSLRHSASIASASAVTERNSRLRSGSLTLLPTGGLSNAFGPSIFSSSWLTNPRSGNISTLDEIRSTTSLDSGVGDEFDVHTLDYLGLDDGGRPPPPATVSELRNQAQAAIAGSLANPSRIRANTVSNPYRNRTTGPMLPPTQSEDETELNEQYDSQQPVDYDASLAQSTGFFPQSLINKGFKQASHLAAARPRAVSVANLDDAARSAPARRSTADSNAFGEVTVSPTGLAPAANITTGGHPTQPTLRTDKLHIARSAGSPTIRFPNGERAFLSPGGVLSGRAVSPKTENASGQIQTPSRSLWIGNLDSTMSSDALIHVFAPYGAIESLRLLPEKECGFVNFVEQADAIRAKEDVLNRLGGHIGMQNGQTVRIGFGKADSAPIAPAKGIMSPGGVVSPGGAGQRASPGGLNSPGGMDAQLQSTPTRALWIGSIPSTTTPATILSVFSPYGPIESARVLTHKNCGFINFERLDDAVRARKALNGRDVLGSDVGAIRIGFAKVPVKGGSGDMMVADEAVGVGVQGVGDLSVGATIHALRSVKGASTIPADQQVLGGAVENYRSNLLLSMIGQGVHNGVSSPDAGTKQAGWTASITEQQMIMKEITKGACRLPPPTMYYTTIPLVAERQQNRRWDASKLRELRKRLDSGGMTGEEVDEVAKDFVDGEIVDLASDWLGNTVVQKLFEKCSDGPRLAMLERIVPHLATIGIHKNGTWAAQKIIECISTPEELALVAQNLRPYTPPLLLDQFGNYVVQCCLRFGSPANEFVFDSMVDRLWEVAQGRFGARSVRACLESPHVTLSQQRRLATAIILNSIPLATNPNGALLLTWLLDTSAFPARYKLLAPRFTPHLSHLCTHKLASLTVLRIINQKVEPEASNEIVQALFNSPGDHVLTDVLGDQVNGVAVVHKVLTSAYLDPVDKPGFLEATKRVLIELKVIATQAYRRLIEEVGLPIPNFQPQYSTNIPQPVKQKSASQSSGFGMSGLATGYGGPDPSLASMMAALQMQVNNSNGQVLSPTSPQNGPPQLQINPNYGQGGNRLRSSAPSGAAFSPTSDPFNPFSLRSPEFGGSSLPASRNNARRTTPSTSSPSPMTGLPFNAQSPSLAQAGTVLGMSPGQYGVPQNGIPPHVYNAYMYQVFGGQNPQNVGAGFHN
ncbi:hypothetical protein JB92DRAFT_3122025 [Gautieria morchelliformis]|nr:hypothetical protein JB92DRAFT_3122025 [Gautieria morchelliformis]